MRTIDFDAMRITQPSGRVVYAFATTPDVILRIATIARIGRAQGDKLIGYQRPEAAKRVAEIRQYLEGSESVLPNTIVVAFDDRVRFIPHYSMRVHSLAEYGTLAVPEVDDGMTSSGFIVDGQQRLAALASSSHTCFPLFVTAIIAPSVMEQRKQFVLVNRIKPLPQGMVFELLPEIDGVLPKFLSQQRFAAIIVTELNLRENSSLYRRIKTPTCPTGYIGDNSIRRMVLNSLSDGALYDMSQEERDEAKLLDGAVRVLSTFWEGASLTFGDACDLPPKQSRLTHGVGIVAMGYVMDHIYTRELGATGWNAERIATILESLRENCAWTEGVWYFGDAGVRQWNELQNTDKDIRLLMNHFRRFLQKRA